MRSRPREPEAPEHTLVDYRLVAPDLPRSDFTCLRYRGRRFCGPVASIAACDDGNVSAMLTRVPPQLGPGLVLGRADLHRQLVLDPESGAISCRQSAR